MNKIEMTFEELFDYLNFLEDDILDDIRFVDEPLFIDTPNGLTPLRGIIKKKTKQMEIVHELGVSRVSDLHIFIDENEKEVFAKNAEHLVTKMGISKIISKEYIEDDILFDISIDDPHIYYTSDGVLHHNTALKISIASANLLKKKNVLYISLEMPEMEIAKRIDSNLLGVKTQDLENLSFEEYSAKFETLRPHLGKLVIKEYSAGTFDTIMMKGLLDDLKNEQGFVPEIIVVDYLGLMKSARGSLTSFGGTYGLMRSIAEELHGFAKKNNVAILTGGQLNRSAYGNQDAGAETISESMGILHTLDTAIFMISNEEMRNENQMILSIQKNRNTGKMGKVLIGADFSKMRFYDIDAVPTEQQQTAGTLLKTDDFGFNSGGLFG